MDLLYFNIREVLHNPLAVNIIYVKMKLWLILTKI